MEPASNQHSSWGEFTDPLIGAVETKTMVRLQFIGAAAIAIGIVVLAVFIAL